MAKLIFGCGYLGLRVARLWRARNEPVYVVTRSADRARQLAAEGMMPLVADVVEGTKVSIPPEVRVVLFALGNDRQGGHSTTDVYLRGMRNALDWMPPGIDRFLYISSTGVYGQGSGDWVDEDSACQPLTDGGRASLGAEQLLLDSRWKDRALVLRLAGLYGPGRLPRMADVVAGRPIPAVADGWLNLIHIDDAAQVVVRAGEVARPPRIYVVSDGHPAVRRSFYEELARLLKAPPPTFVAPAQDSSASRRAASDKRVNPHRLFAELQLELLFADYVAGLAAIVG